MAEEIRVEVEGGSEKGRRLGRIRFLLLIPGLFFVGLGVLVIVVPEVIVAMVAATFFMIGVGLLIAGTKLGRKASRASFFFDGRISSR